MWQLASMYSALGIEMVLAVAIGMGGGMWIDARLGIAPWGALGGFAIGVGAAVQGVRHVLRRSRALMGSRSDPGPDAER